MRGRRRQLDYDFTGLREAQFFASNFADGLRVGLQILDLLLEGRVFLIQFIQGGVDLLNLLLFVAHDQVAVRAENVVYDENNDKDDEHLPAVQAN